MAVYEAYQESCAVNNAGKIVLRCEQKTAVEMAQKCFKKGFTAKAPFRKFLWNAKMRFGKTLCAMELAKRMGVKRTLIVTHRPVVNKSWAEDFEKIFEKSSYYRYGTKFEKDEFGNFYDLESFAQADGKHYVFFASMQYLRLSKLVKEDGDDDPLKKSILENKWDLVVIDEAHEGTQTTLGHRVVEKLSKCGTCVLHLSGTPFNLYDDFEDDEVFTWDYLAEQKAKLEWPKKHPGEPNPYAELPRMKIFTYNLGNLVKGEGFIKEGAGFMFSEFFRTWTGNTKIDGQAMPEGVKKGKFVYEEEVNKFLNLLCKKDDGNNYPFSTTEYQKNFKHTLWVVPGVKAAKALEALLKQHPVFKRFSVINVAGNTDDDVEDDNALKRVLNTIGDAPERKYTITISCGRLTTGVTVRPWTAVFYMKGSENTNVATYMQTIFRVQTPYHTLDGRMKAECYVFDFAPDRSLRMMAETARFFAKTSRNKLRSSSVAKKQELDEMKNLLEFCPVIAYDGGKMKPFDENELFAKLSEAKIDRVVQRGFDDNALYNVDELLRMNPDAVNELRDILGETRRTEATAIDLSKAGLTAKGKKSGAQKDTQESEEDEDTKEEKAAKAAARKERDNRIAILRGVSLRIPLLMFGAEVANEDKAISLENFVNVIDDASWVEFMPRGFTKNEFETIKVCYDKVVFEKSWERYRQLAREADSLSIEERIKTIATIFSYFHNPDKETVLTPWRVVNMHMSDTIGGYAFFNEKFDGPNLILNDKNELVETTAPRWVEHDNVSQAIFKQADNNGDTSVKILEVNSKTGLYPLYMTYSLYRSILPTWLSLYGEDGVLSLADEQALWDKILQENIFVICNTPMAARITERTLRGFRKVDNLHIKNENLIELITTDRDSLVKQLKSKTFWFGKESGVMKFDVIVGNPPYQENIGRAGAGNDALSRQIFPWFVIATIEARPNYLTLITPSRWFTADAQDKSFIKLREFIKTHNHYKLISHFPKSKTLFPNVEIAGGVNYFLYDSSHAGNVDFTENYGEKIVNSKRPLFEKGLDIVIPMKVLLDVVDKVTKAPDFVSMMTMTQGRNAFGVVGKKSALQKMTQPTAFDGAIEVRCAYEEIRYARRNVITKNVKLMDSWKVFTSKGNGGAGILGDDKPVSILGKPYIGPKGSVCTDSLIPIGSFETKEEAENLQGYMKTKFFRFMVGVLKTSQNVYQTVYRFVPVQDFSKSWDDAKLYKKYKLTKSEIEIIESMIKPME